jgi:hypothetical protein
MPFCYDQPLTFFQWFSQSGFEKVYVAGRSPVAFASGSAGGRYQTGEGEIEVDSIEQIAIQDITHALAIESGFLGVIDLLKVAKHGPSENVYLVRFHYICSRAGRPAPR